MNLAGTTVNDRYHLNAVLGTGGMATVYQAHDNLLNRTVALKLLSPAFVAQASTLRRFMAEAHVMMHLHHPNVVSIMDFGSAPQPFIAMEVMSGGSLRDLLLGPNQTEQSRVFDIIDGVLSGLIRVHASGVIHRDIKPANILLTNTGTAKLTDFGIARTISRVEFQTRTNARMGSPAFMAPEQRKSATRVNETSDLYAVGATLYTLLTQRSTIDLYVREQQEEAFDDLAPSLRAFLTQACAFNGADRFENAAAMQAALRAVRDDAAGTRSHQALKASSESRAGNLPAPTGGFVGRTDELEHLLAWADSTTNRILCLVGLGGIGKSRLALEFCQLHKRRFPGGIWLTDLSASPTESAINRALGSALGLNFEKTDALEKITEHLNTKKDTLLVFDNAEDATSDLTPTVSFLLEQVPTLRVMVTSREKLDAPSEAVLSVSELNSRASVALLMQSARHTFAMDGPTPEGARAIEDIARLLEGHPLSLELAAAQLEMMAPSQLYARLYSSVRPGGPTDSPTLLGVLENTIGHRVSPSSSVHASLQWSWSLLSEAEQSALAQCAVFIDGFDVEAAEAIVNIDAFPAAPPVMVLLQTLRSKNLLRIRTPLPGCRRLSVPRMVGYFVLSHSDHATLNSIRHRMARHYAQMGTEVRIQHHQTDGVHGHRIAKLEIPNMQYGFDWAMEQQDTELAGLLCLAIAELLKRSGPYEDLTEMLRRVETGLNADTPLLARVILARGQLAANREGLDTVEELLLKAISVADSIDFVSVGIQARVSLAYTILRTNRSAEAMRVAEASVQAAEQAEDSYLLPSSLYCRGYVTYKSGETREALADLLAALRGFQRLGNRIREGKCYGVLGEYYHTVGEPQRAKMYYEDAQAIAHEQGDKSALIRGQRRLAWLHIDGGDWVQAEEALHQGLDIARDLGDLPGEGSLVGTLGTVAAAAGRFDEALDRLWEAVWIYKQHGNTAQSQNCQMNISLILEKLGRVEEASEVIDQIKGAGNILPLTRTYVELMEMKILIRGEEWRKAHALGVRVMPSLEKMQAWHHTITLNAYSAICEAALGGNPEPNLVKAEATLKRLNLAENSPEGTIVMESRAQATELYSRFDP